MNPGSSDLRRIRINYVYLKKKKMESNYFSPFILWLNGFQNTLWRTPRTKHKLGIFFPAILNADTRNFK